MSASKKSIWVSMSSDSKTGSVVMGLSSLFSVWVWIFEAEKNSSISKSTAGFWVGPDGSWVSGPVFVSDEDYNCPVSDQADYLTRCFLDHLINPWFRSDYLSCSVKKVYYSVRWMKFMSGSDFSISWFKVLGWFWGNKPWVTVSATKLLLIICL